MSEHRMIVGHDEALCRWVESRIDWGPGGAFPPGTPAIGVARGDKLLCAVVYHDYQPDFGTVQITMASSSPMWARRENIRALLHYPFRQIQCYKVWWLTRADNTHGIKTFEHVGFKREATLAHQFGRKRHGIVGRMLEPDYRRIYEDG